MDESLMPTTSKIEWTGSTWNPITGCTKISAGCVNCYAERMAHRLQAMGSPNYRNGFKVTLHHKALETPLKWRKPRVVFVNSMSDLFHKNVPFDFISQVFDVMCRAPAHVFQMLTKRSHRLLKLEARLPWPENIWMGVTVENSHYYNRIDDLRMTAAATKFLSLEPLLEPLPDLDLAGIDWVIVGGESGPHARPIRREWVLQILRQCREQQVPFFFKQWGGVNKKRAGRLLNGKTYDEVPAGLQDFQLQSRLAL